MDSDGLITWLCRASSANVTHGSVVLVFYQPSLRIVVASLNCLYFTSWLDSRVPTICGLLLTTQQRMVWWSVSTANASLLWKHMTTYRHWMDIVPLVLLDTRAAPKDDVGCSTAELVYGAPLRLKGEFFSVSDDTLPLTTNFVHPRSASGRH